MISVKPFWGQHMVPSICRACLESVWLNAITCSMAANCDFSKSWNPGALWCGSSLLCWGTHFCWAYAWNPTAIISGAPSFRDKPACTTDRRIHLRANLRHSLLVAHPIAHRCSLRILLSGRPCLAACLDPCAQQASRVWQVTLACKT